MVIHLLPLGSSRLKPSTTCLPVIGNVKERFLTTTAGISCVTAPLTQVLWSADMMSRGLLKKQSFPVLKGAQAVINATTGIVLGK